MLYILMSLFTIAPEFSDLIFYTLSLTSFIIVILIYIIFHEKDGS